MDQPSSLPEPRLPARRALLGAAARAAAALAFAGLSGALATLSASRRRAPHPEPRPGIDASHMLPPEKVRAHPGAVAAFDEARTIPEILDGIRCHCSCADLSSKRSLLSCYEEDGMALDCDICQGEARLAFRLHRKGRTLAQIRDAIDARYGV